MCSVQGCTKETKARGWCKQHYQRWFKTGSTELSEKKKGTRSLCTVLNCEHISICRGLCRSHYEQLPEYKEKRKVRESSYKQEPSFKKAKCEGAKRYRNTERGRAVKREYDRRRHINKVTATPPWVDKEPMWTFYASAPPGNEVDHIIPIKHDKICGLHVAWNLQYLPESLNASKHNKFDPYAYTLWLTNQTDTMFLGDKVVPIGGSVIASPTEDGINNELTDVIGENENGRKSISTT